MTEMLSEVSCSHFGYSAIERHIELILWMYLNDGRMLLKYLLYNMVNGDCMLLIINREHLWICTVIEHSKYETAQFLKGDTHTM